MEDRVPSRNIFKRRMTLLVIIATVLVACSDQRPINPFPGPTRAPINSGSQSNQVQPAATPAPGTTVVPGTTPESVTFDTVGLIRDAITSADDANANLVETTDIPPGDLRTLAIKFKGLPADSPTVTCTTAPDYQIGDEETFSAFNSDSLETFSVKAGGQPNGRTRITTRAPTRQPGHCSIR